MRVKLRHSALGLVALLVGVAGIAVAAPKPSDAGEAFFDSNVITQLSSHGCAACHAQNYVRPRVLEYRELLPYLAMGSSAEKNVLIYKMANLRSIKPGIPAHLGGVRCPSLDAEPCKTFRQWWRIEFGAGSPAAAKAPR